MSGYEVLILVIVPTQSASVRTAAATATLIASPRPEIFKVSTAGLAAAAGLPSVASLASTPFKKAAAAL